MNFLRNLFGKKQQGPDESTQSKGVQADESLSKKIQSFVYWVFPYYSPSSGEEGFLLRGFHQGELSDVEQGHRIEGRKILVVEPGHKKYIVDKGNLRSRVIFQTTVNMLQLDKSIQIVLDAIRRIENSRSKDAIVVIECRGAKMFVDLLMGASFK